MRFTLQHGGRPCRGFARLGGFAVLTIAATLALASPSRASTGRRLSVGSLTTEHMTNPLGLDVALGLVVGHPRREYGGGVGHLADDEHEQDGPDAVVAGQLGEQLAGPGVQAPDVGEEAGGSAA